MNFNNKEAFNSLPDAILFDLDNTLYAYEPAHKAAWYKVIKKVTSLFMIEGIQFSKAFFEARSQIKYQLGNTASSHSRLLYFQRTLELLGLGAHLISALDLEQTYWYTFLHEAKVFDGVTETFNEIRYYGIPIIIITDLTAQIQMRKLINFELDKYIDYLVTSEESGGDKIQYSSYKLTLHKISKTKGVFWMIGDSVKNDIEASKKAINAITIQKLHKGVYQSKKIKPDASFKEFLELKNLISNLSHKSK